MDPNQERIDSHLDEWDNLTEQERQYIEDGVALREMERESWSRFLEAQAARIAAINAAAEAIMTIRGW